MDVEPVTGADRALELIGDVLLADEARHNLAFGILSTALAHPEVYPELRAWIVRDGARIAGAALRTPPHNLVVARPDDDRAIEALAAGDRRRVARASSQPSPRSTPSSPRGRHGTASPASRSSTSGSTRCGPSSPHRRPPGRLRLARADDRALALSWIRAFADEALHGGDDDDGSRLERSVDARLESDQAGIAFWEVDGEPVSLAGFGGPTPNGVRIGPVYTPPTLRGRGYGTAVTAAVSQLLLDRGHRFCFLYTNLENPTSNAIYMRIGYEPVCDSREVAFVP